MSDDAPNRAWAIEEAARAALLAIEQGRSFDHLDDVIAPALRQALRDPRIANTELRRLSAVEAQRDALLEALKWLDKWMSDKTIPECVWKVRAAIKAAEENT